MSYPVNLDDIIHTCEAECNSTISDATRELLRLHFAAVADAYKAGFKQGLKGGEVA